MQKALAAILLALCGPAPAAEVSVEYTRTQAYAGFGAIDHVAVGLALPLEGFRPLLKLERRRQAGVTGHFVEGIFALDLGPRAYSLTRVGFTDENSLFVDDALYQEFGFKSGRWGPAFIDLNAGIGTRQFTTASERFVAFGPTASWATGALWLRREQSASAGGHRHTITVRQAFAPRWQIEAFAMDEKRRKFTLPLGPGVTATDFEGRRYSLALWHRLTPVATVFARGEHISLERGGTPGKYYAPTAFGVGVILDL